MACHTGSLTEIYIVVVLFDPFAKFAVEFSASSANGILLPWGQKLDAPLVVRGAISASSGRSLFRREGQRREERERGLQHPQVLSLFPKASMPPK